MSAMSLQTSELSELEKRERESRQAADAVRIAFTHLFLRQSGPAPRCERPHLLSTDGLSDAEFRIAMSRRVADWVGQPERCENSRCRRAKLCEGTPPECWRNEPPITQQEDELARMLLRYHLDRTVEMNRAKEQGGWRSARSAFPSP